MKSKEILITGKTIHKLVVVSLIFVMVYNLFLDTIHLGKVEFDTSDYLSIVVIVVNLGLLKLAKNKGE